MDQIDEYPCKNFAGITVSGFKSFGPTMQAIGPVGKFNIFAGKNNAGKSNCLEAIRLTLNQSQQNGSPNLNRADHGFNRETEPCFGVLLHSIEHEAPSEFWRNNREVLTKDWPRIRDAYSIPFESTGSRAGKYQVLEDITQRDSRAWVMATESQWDVRVGGDFMKAAMLHMERMLDGLGPVNIMTITPHRKLNLQAENGDPEQFLDRARQGEFTGELVTSLIYYLQEPEPKLIQSHGALYRKFCSFVRDVFESPDASIRVPSSRKGINVSFGGRPARSITDFGTGLTQILMIAAACSFVSRLRIFIEEPETNLHPTLLRKLAQYLIRKTDNQYFITTHAAALIDTPGANVFHVELDPERGTSVANVGCHGSHARTCFDLGYRASDLVQANCIVWVEGPSDRIYIRHWMKLVDKDLQEGAHYSFMFYGGGLYVHLSGAQADQEEIRDEDLLSLVRMNQNSAFVADSDRTDANADHKPRRLRLKKSIEAAGGFAWVTDGREIENYIPIDLLKQAAEEVHPRSDYLEPTDPVFGDAVKVRSRPKKGGSEWGKPTDFDKIGVAKKIVERPELNQGLVASPLRSKIWALANFIRRSNGLNSLPPE